MEIELKSEGAGGDAACIGPTLCAGQRETALASLQESRPHALQLEQLRKAERRFGKEAIFHNKSYRRVCKEIYDCLGLFALLISLMVLLLAHEILTCHRLWAPILAIVLGAAATCWGLWDRLRFMSKHKAEAHVMQTRQSAVHDKIQEMLQHGAACSLHSLVPHHHLPTPGLARSNPACCLERSYFLSPRAIFALLFLVSVSVICIATAISTICGPR